MRLRRSRKIWRVHEGHDFEPSSQFKPPNASKLNPPNFTGSPNRFSTVGAAREITTIKFQQVIPILKRFTTRSRLRTPNVKSTANCGHFHSGKFQMEGDRISEVRAELLDSLTSRSSFFEAVLNSGRAQPNCANNKKDRSAYGSDLGNYADCEKWQRQKLDGVRR